jgi:hypothetical protein
MPHEPVMAIHLHQKAGEMAKVNALDRLETRAVPDVREAFTPRSCGAMLEDRLGQAYNEEAFQHLLSIEFKRSERSKRPFLLLLLDLKEQAGTTRDIAPEVAAKLVSSLACCLRETDFIGWYREGQVVGAVLTQSQDVLGAEISHVIGQRVRDALRGTLPASTLERLKMRAYQRPPSLKGRD